MPSASATPATPRRRIDRRRLVLLGVVWAAATGLALALALALDQPVGSGERDAAQPIVAGPIVAPGDELTGGPSQLPPLALVLDRPLPGGAGNAPVETRVALLSSIVERRPSAENLVALGVAHQGVGQTAPARAAYRRALARAPGYVPARVGLAMADGAIGSAGLARGAATLARLQAELPASQIVAFNSGWLAIYRRQAAPARAAWQRTVELGPGTRLGRTAQTLLEALDAGPSGRNP